MAKAIPKVWTRIEYAELADVNERTLYTWGGESKLGKELAKKGKTKIDLVKVGREWMVIDNARSRARIVNTKSLKTKPSKVPEVPKLKESPKKVKVPKPIETKKAAVSGSIGRTMLEFKKIKPLEEVSTERKPFTLPAALVIIHEDLRVMKNHSEDQKGKKALADWLGIPATELAEKHLPFVVIGPMGKEKYHYIASYVEDLKSELVVDKRVA